MSFFFSLLDEMMIVSAPPPPGLSILDCCPIGFLLRLFVLCLVCPMLSVSLNCPLYTAPSVFSCQCLWIVHSWLSLQFSLTFICSVSCVPNVTSVSGLSILDCPFSFLLRLFVLCLVCPMLPVSLDCPFFTSPSVFSCQCLWIVHSWLPLQFSLTFICPVSFVPNVTSISGLPILDCSFSFL